MAGDFIGSLSLPATTMSTQNRTESLLLNRKARRLSAPAPPKHLVASSSTCNSPALDLYSTGAAPAAVLGSVRALVLSHLADLERRLSQFSHQDFNISDSLKSRTMDEARVWATEGLDMLSTIRADVCSHLPDVPFDAAFVEDLCKTHLHDFSLPRIIDDIRSRLPDVPHLRSSFSAIDFSDMQSKFKGVCSQLPAVPAEFAPSQYLNTLSQRLHSLHTHIYSSHPFVAYRRPSLPTSASVSDLLDKVLSSDYVPDVLHRVDGQESKFEKAAREMSDALRQSVNGARLVTYMDLPVEWRNNPFVSRGYR